MSSKRPPRVLAISSGGGHWVQLLRLRPAFEGCDVSFATVREAYRQDLEPGDAESFHVIPDATRWDKLGLIKLAFSVLWILVRRRPKVVISTGAAPGYFAIRLGNVLGARTIWVDSIANAEELSMTGRIVGPRADLWLTQWEHLAKPVGESEGASKEGPRYAGAVI